MEFGFSKVKPIKYWSYWILGENIILNKTKWKWHGIVQKMQHQIKRKKLCSALWHRAYQNSSGMVGELLLIRLVKKLRLLL